MKNSIRALALLSLIALSSPSLAGNYVGDYNVGDNVDCNFGTVNPSTGASFTLAGTPVISAYIDNSTTELTAGITLTTDFDTRTGMNHVRVVASGGNGYAAGTFVSLVITAGTVNSVSVVGQEVCSFTLRKGTITGIPAATAGAAGGIQIAGSNAATTYASVTVTGTTTLSDGLVVSRSTSNTSAATFTGNGTGNGATFTSGSGATGNGAQFTAASTNGNGIGLTATGTGATMTITPSNIQQIAGTSITTLTGAYPSLGIIDSGTAQAATSTTLQIRSAATFADNEVSGASCLITGGTTGVGQSRTVSSSVGSTDTLTVPAWTTTPTGTITYVCFGTAPGSGGGGPTASQVATAVWQDSTSGDFTVASSIGKSLYTTGATPGASGGIQIAGSNAATSYADFDVTANASFSGGLTITQSTSNQAALVVTGNGTGNGATFTSGSGLTGNGLQATAASTNGNGVGLTATGSGVPMTIAPSNMVQIAGQTASASGTVTFPNSTLASTTNITGGTINNLTNAPTAGDLTATMKASVQNAVTTAQNVLTGTCASGSTTTCTDAALTQANATQLQDRLICFSDNWCGLITTFNPGTDTATTTKVAPTSRASLTYQIFPSTTQ